MPISKVTISKEAASCQRYRAMTFKEMRVQLRIQELINMTRVYVFLYLPSFLVGKHFHSLILRSIHRIHILVCKAERSILIRCQIQCLLLAQVSIQAILVFQQVDSWIKNRIPFRPLNRCNNSYLLVHHVNWQRQDQEFSHQFSHLSKFLRETFQQSSRCKPSSRAFYMHKKSALQLPCNINNSSGNKNGETSKIKSCTSYYNDDY